jgi:hypothetical protein
MPRTVFIQASKAVEFRWSHPVRECHIPAGWYDDLGFDMVALNLSAPLQTRPRRYQPSVKHTYRIKNPVILDSICW